MAIRWGTQEEDEAFRRAVALRYNWMRAMSIDPNPFMSQEAKDAWRAYADWMTQWDMTPADVIYYADLVAS